MNEPKTLVPRQLPRPAGSGPAWRNGRVRALGAPLLPFLAGLLFLLSCSDSTGPGTPGEPESIQVVDGQGVQAPAGTVVPHGPTVRVLDGEGRPVPGATVHFQVLEGGGSTPLSWVQTDNLGRARGIWILGDEAGIPQRLGAKTGDHSAEFQATALEAVPGESYYGRNLYVEYLPGTLPLVLSAPHGGDMEPQEIPDRSWGTTVTDRNVRELALRVRAAVFSRTGQYPHVVISHLDRIKLDPNREIEEAAQGDPESARAWWEYHTFIERAETLVEEASGEGFYIDLHGHGHPVQRLELGYLLGGSALASSDETLEGMAAQTSIRTLAGKPGASLATLLRGPLSLGSLLEAQEIPAVPSQAQPHPGDEPFFSGGYSTARHGSRDGGPISGVQIECNYTGIRDTSEHWIAFGEAMAQALEVYFPAHFGFSFAPEGGPVLTRHR